MTELYTKDDTSGEYTQYTAPAFHDRLPEDLRENEHLKGVEGSAGLAQSYVDLKSAQPVVPEEYGFEAPDGIKIDDTGLEGFRPLAKELGLSQEAFDKIVAFDLERAKRFDEDWQKSIKVAQEATVTELKKEWGDAYQANMDRASKSVRRFVDEDTEAKLKEAGFMDNPNVIRLMHTIGNAISEGSFLPGKGRPAARRVGEDGKPMLSFPSMEK